MDINEDTRGPDEDESLLEFYAPTSKAESECLNQRPDSRGSEVGSVMVEETDGRTSPLQVPSTLEPSASPQPTAYQEAEHFPFDPFEYPENEVARSKMISDALQQEDEFLEYLMSLPISHKFSEVVDEKHDHCDLRLENSANIGSGIGESEDPTPPTIPPVSKVGLDHLDNLCKLMEQLGELRDQNSKLQRRVQYLEDLKSLHDMHKQLQDSLDIKRKADRRSPRETEDLQGEARFSPGLSAQRAYADDAHEPGESRLTVKRHASEESVLHGISPMDGYALDCGSGGDSKNNTKRKSHPRSRQSFLRQQYRERSRSVGHEEVGEAVREAIKNPRKSVHLQWQRQRRGYVKSKVSKWTKVKEAFRWEKAQLDGCSQRTEAGDFTSGLPESKSQDSGIGLGQRQASEDRPHSDEGNNPPQCFLRVISGKEGEPSASPSDSVLGGSSSPYHAYSYALSSSSSSSDDLMEIDLNLSSISEAIDIGPQRSASATDSTADKLVQNEAGSEQRGRRSLSQGQEEDAARRSKSLDCEDIQRPYAGFVLDDKSGSISKKAHRTPWGKVKDIIQTRRDSVKKRQKEEGRREEGRREEVAARADAEAAAALCDQEEEGERSGCESPDECGGDGGRWQQRAEDTRPEGKERRKGFRTSSPPPSSPRRLTPTLTVTLPSTEELSGTAEGGVGAGEGQRARLGEGKEDRSRGHSDCEEPEALGAHHRKDGQFGQLGDVALDVAGTSPPAPRRPSKWTKVKKAFLTARKEVEGTARGVGAAGVTATEHPIGAGRLPCSEYHARRLADHPTVSHGLRIYLEGCGSSGVNHDADRILGTRGRREALEAPAYVTAPPSPAADSSSSRTIGPTAQRDIQKNYDELQQKLSQEFHKKLNEWERMKGGWCTVPEGKGDENEELRKKAYDWEKNKDKGSGRAAAPDESHLPIDFRKRLTEWKRVRGAASETRPEAIGGRGRGVPGVARGSVISDDESLPPQFRKRLVEWQLWRAVTGKSDQNVEELHKILPEEFYRKLQEWERIKAETVVPVRVGSGRRYGRRDPGAGLVMRKDASALGRVVRRMRANEVVLGERWSRQRNEVAREAKHRGKEVQWLEKELQKVEREKMRLEREREKYLEREARLERMRKAMGERPPGKQEVLIQTSTGFFRFQGISEKFTRKLYEWEKQRGIGPEASTFALLDPTYRPAAPSAASADVTGDSALDALRSSTCAPGTPALPRSRSEGSLAESGAASGGPVHSRSSSLGHVDGKERSRSMEQEVPSRASSEPRMRSETRAMLVAEETEEEDDDEEETAALLVEVEDVEEETAAALEELPTLPSETPIYSYAPEEVTRLIDSSGSESEKDCKCYGDASINRSSSVRTQSSYELIEENMSLINKLKMKENICRELENEIEDLEGKIHDIAKTHQEELERLRREETGFQEKSKEQSSVAEEAGNSSGSVHGSSHGEIVAQLKLRVNELERCKEQLKQEEENLQTSFQVHSEQQEALAQNLVGKMKLLQEVSKVVGGQEEDWVEGEVGDSEDRSCIYKRLDSDLNDSHSMAVVQHLSSELLQLAEKLELTLADRNQEIRNLRFELQDRKKIGRSEYQENKSAVFRSGQTRNWSSAEGVHLSPEENLVPLSDSKMIKFTKTMIPRQSSEELAELPFLLTSKVLELKKELGNLCNSKDPKMSYQRYQPSRGKLQRIPNFQAEEEESESELKRNTPEKDHYTAWRSRRGVDDRISYRPPPRPQAGAEEAREWTARRPNSARYSAAFEGRGSLEAEGATCEGGAAFRPKPETGDSSRDAHSSERSRSVGAPSGAEGRKGEARRWKGEREPVEEAVATEVRGVVDRGAERGPSGAKKGADEGTKGSVEEERTARGKDNLLKTRRISDTHVTYDSTRPSKVPRSGTRELPPSPTHTLKDPESLEKSEGGNAAVTGVRWTGDSSRLPSNTDSEHSAPNVFVQTTRKIFSPVCGSSKGSDASNVIGYVEEYLEEGGAVGEAGEAGAPPWRRRSGALPPTERVAPRPHRPPGEPPRGGVEGGGRAGHRSDPPSTPPCAHPLPPPSPLSGRRDKTKEAAPSIRLMIAKYDLKQQQQQEGGGDGRSPESRSSGGRSPAWLSPTADRRDLFGMGGVRAQMEKYQEEVRKALMGYSNSEAATVQKSASAGIIRSFGLGSCLKPPLHSIAKSSSAGAIKSGVEEASTAPTHAEQSSSTAAPLFRNVEKRTEDGTVQMNESIEKTLKMLRERHPSPPPSPSRSNKFSHVRALRLKKAKEEFMRSSTAGRAAVEEDTHSKFHPASPSSSISANKEEGNAGDSGEVYVEEDSRSKEASEVVVVVSRKDAAAEREENKIVEGATGVAEGASSEGERASCGVEEGAAGSGGGVDARSRHSQISFGSESSYEDSAAQEGLIKSASSGMIDVYSQKCKQVPMAKVSEREGGKEMILSSNSSKCLTSVADGTDGQGTSKLGILSRFRRVKLRTKKMSAISALCRQSLLVSVEKEGGEREEGEGEGSGKRRGVGEGGKQKSKSTAGYSVPLCRSCPSSPVPSSKKPENSGCWIHNPKHVFKPQRDREENFPKLNVGVSFPSKS